MHLEGQRALNRTSAVSRKKDLAAAKRVFEKSFFGRDSLLTFIIYFLSL